METILDAYKPVSSQQIQEARKFLEETLSRVDLGFHQIPTRDHLWSEVEERGSEIRAVADDLVVVGIGGSSLGPKALYEVLREPQSEKRLFFCDNVDTRAFENIWKEIRNPERTAWVFISKSGSTIETLVAADLILQRYQSQKWKISVTVISEKKSNPLSDWAVEKSVPVLEIPQDVGGRFSVLTAVGMLPMSFLGLNIREFQTGAQAALQDYEFNAEMMVHFYQSFQRQEWITFFWFYNSAYETFGRWLQQLWAESLAKTKDRQGRPGPRVSTPMWGIGACDQHSLLQQLMEGFQDKFIVFFRFANTESGGEKVVNSQFKGQVFFNGHQMGELIAAQAQGTRLALNENGASTLTVRVEDLTPKSLGFQMMSWQLVVAGLGEMLDINAFDQPGVELGKRLAKSILKS
jgi:glucose-6-phosphate isomerase